MSWKCKKCDGKFFTQTTKGKIIITEMNKKGELKEYEENTINYGRFTCDNCGKKGKSIKEIAKWEENK